MLPGLRARQSRKPEERRARSWRAREKTSSFAGFAIFSSFDALCKGREQANAPHRVRHCGERKIDGRSFAFSSNRLFCACFRPRAKKARRDVADDPRAGKLSKRNLRRGIYPIYVRITAKGCGRSIG